MGSELQRYEMAWWADFETGTGGVEPRGSGDGEWVKYDDHAQRIAELEAESLRFYNADGTFEVCASAEEVVDRRKAAAVRIAELEAELDKPCGDCEAVQQCGHHQIHEKSVSGIDNNGMEQCADWCEVCDEQVGPLQARVAELEARAEKAERRVAVVEDANRVQSELLRSSRSLQAKAERELLRIYSTDKGGWMAVQRWLDPESEFPDLEDMCRGLDERMEKAERERDELEVELAVRRKDDEDAAGALLLPIPSPGSDVAKMFRVRRQLLDRAEEAERELAQLQADVDAWCAVAGESQANFKEVWASRAVAIQRVAELEARAEKAERELGEAKAEILAFHGVVHAYEEQAEPTALAIEKAQAERDELAEKLAKATGALDHIARLGCNYSEPCEELGMDGVCPPCIAQRLMDQIAPQAEVEPDSGQEVKHD